MKKILILVLVSIIIFGCGKTLKATDTIDTEIKTNETKTEIIKRVPLPIDRIYNINNGIISFNDVLPGIYLQYIQYDNKSSTDNIAIYVPDNSYNNKTIKIAVKGKTKSFIIPNTLTYPTTISFWSSTGPTSNTTFCMNIASDVLDINNTNDYIQLSMDGKILENYWISDFKQ